MHRDVRWSPKRPQGRGRTTRICTALSARGAKPTAPAPRGSMSTDPLDALAERLRELLLRQAGDPDAAPNPAPPGEIRALVARGPPLWGREPGAEFVRRVAGGAFGVGPLEPLLADPDV